MKTAQCPEAAFGPGCPGAAVCPLPSWTFFPLLSSQKADRDTLHPVSCTAGLLTDLFWSCSAVFARGMDCHSAFPVFSQLPFCQGRLLFDSPWKQFYGNRILGIRRTGSHGGGGGGTHCAGGFGHVPVLTFTMCSVCV